MTQRWTEDEIGDRSGTVALVTGANSGIGWEAARALAQHGAHVVMACRSTERASEALERIEATDPAGSLEIIELDLADLGSVARAAKDFGAHHDRLEVLVNNAGLMWTPRQRTAQGFEMQFGVNHLGHFALTGHLMPVLASAERARVVTVSSMGHRPGRIDFDDINSDDGYSPYRAYFQSKLANLLFTRELQRRLAGIHSTVMAVAAHPGASETNLGHESPGGLAGRLMVVGRPLTDRLFTQSAQMGALPTLRAATDPAARGGDYFGPGGFMEQRGHPVKVEMSSRARDLSVARRLWDLSEEMTGVRYPG